MREVSQTEAIQTLPALLKEAQTHPIGIEGEDGAKAFIVSPDGYRQIRMSAIRRMKAISRRASKKIEAHAAELGISPDALLEQWLKDE